MNDSELKTAISSVSTVDFSQIREDFPILKQNNRNFPLVYLDSAASAQKPRQVIQAMERFYLQDYANIHRGVYELSERSTKLYEQTRELVKTFINAASAEEIIFLRGTTEGINLLAHCLGRTTWQAGDEVILSEMEHHANIVPWYLLKETLGIKIKVVPVTDEGELDLDAYRSLFSSKTKLVSIMHASNVLGTINPVKALVDIAHAHDVLVLLDGAQAVPHLPVDVQAINCDFYAFSSHKLYGPTGVGVLYGKKKYLAEMPPYQGGGDMIETVSFDRITFAKAPHRFEAGTPDIGGVIGLGAAIQYLQSIGMRVIAAHEAELLKTATDKLNAIPGLKIMGEAKEKVGAISFTIEDIHPHDIATILDHEGIAIRAGHHCAMPLMKRFNVPAMARASFGLYTCEKDIDALVSAIQSAKRLFA